MKHNLKKTENQRMTKIKKVKLKKTGLKIPLNIFDGEYTVAINAMAGGALDTKEIALHTKGTVDVSFDNYSLTEKTVGLLNANTASSYDLKKLPGIGNSLPYKIVNFREKLGGFLNMQQVKETYGMTDSIFQSILPLVHVLPITIKKLNINTASDFELNAHPYIDKRLSKAITIYRSQHGNYKSVNELKNIVFITDEVLQKITPYLTTD